MNASLSLCMIVRDEEALLAGMLESVAGVADEIIVGVDSRTTDRTAQIAREHGARVYLEVWQDSFAFARNTGLRKARKEWILVLDADDRLTSWGAAQIRQVMRTPRSDIDVYGFTIENRRLDDSVIGRDSLPSMRLFRNYRGIHYVNRAHEELRTKSGEAPTLGWLRSHTGEVGIVTYGYDQALYAQRAKDERNMALIERQLAEQPNRTIMYELARQHWIGHRFAEAADAARQALAMPTYLRPELIAELERIVQKSSAIMAAGVSSTRLSHSD